MFYLYDENSVDEHGDITLFFTADKRNGLPSLAKWDFYLKDDFLLPIENGKLKAMCVKMWRKGDFDRLIKHIENKERLINVKDNKNNKPATEIRLKINDPEFAMFIRSLKQLF